MKNNTIQPVILAGGSGTRLWPLSRKQHPKQYLSLMNGNTMLQETILRLANLGDIVDPIIVCNADHRFLVAEQCKQIGIDNPIILLEPAGRNTAPAITAAALQALKIYRDAVLLVLSADHDIRDVDEFHRMIDISVGQAQLGKLVTFGVVPTSAHSGYGYIKFSNIDTKGVCKVEQFVEKPNLETAQKYLSQGGYLWNSGIFVFLASVLVKELSVYSPNIVESVNHAVNTAKQDLDFIRLGAREFESLPSESIDYALMEKSDKVVMVPLNAGWSDIGSWSALHDAATKDDGGNVIQGDVYIEESTNTYISANHHMVAAIGVDNLIIVDTPDATLVSTKDKSQEVGRIARELQQHDRKEAFWHRKVYRPWGWYDLVESGEGFQVKRLHLKPGGRLSLQLHYKRSEYWVVVKGIATIVINGEEGSIVQGESLYIPAETIHSLANNTNEVLEIIEIQSGTYLGEDDIVRFEDVYGRDKIKD